MNSDKFVPFSSTSEQFQYLNPTQYQELLSNIVSVGRRDVSRELQEALAVIFCVDGSVNRQKIDNKHVCVHILLQLREMSSNVFLAFVNLTKMVSLAICKVLRMGHSPSYNGANSSTLYHLLLQMVRA